MINLNAYNPDYSLRRYYVDRFYAEQVAQLPAGSLVLDLGGHRFAKRGQFNIESLDVRVIYVNLVSTRQPHVVADASNLPFRDHSFDAVICSELLEHVSSPSLVLKEVFRVLKKGGVLFATVPFVFPFHPDPVDYFRYTNMCLEMMLGEAQFADFSVKQQGRFWSVMTDMVRGLTLEGRIRGRWWWRPMLIMAAWLKVKAVSWDGDAGHITPYMTGFTTGFEIIARK